MGPVTTAVAIVLVAIFLVATFNQAVLLELGRYREKVADALFFKVAVPSRRWYHRYGAWLERGKR